MNFKPAVTQITVTTAGTRKQVSTTSLNVRSAIIQALTTNAGKLYVGGVAVDSTHCLTLDPGQSVTLELPGDPLGEIDLTAVYLDAANSGDKANVLYMINA